ncbi:MlaA family lipoprotein [Methylotuvimicrobium buryatense]|uniref:MlaA family lipoprotein n=1 Tax=Methylotuvimicrobium buryatense TaxID=95641 RepID=UPI002E1B28CD|nr:MlaA family lipoprotein [Methylotuvimicrobium buryatense]
MSPNLSPMLIKTVAPDVVRTGVSNFFGNLKTINTVINDVLQGKFQQSAEDSGRFLVNSTVGLGGFARYRNRYGIGAS